VLAKPSIAAMASAVLVLPVSGVHARGSPLDSHQNLRQAITLRDGPGDVWRFDGDSWVPVGARPEADVVAFRAFHGRTNLRFVMSLTDLRRRHDKYFYVGIVTPRMKRWIWVQAWPDHPRGFQGLSKPNSEENLPDRGMTHVIRYDTDTVTIVVPRNLLGRPRWVRVGANDLIPSGPDEDDTLLVDNAFNDGHRLGFSPLTPRLYRS
jgi:hypothetical protein